MFGPIGFLQAEHANPIRRNKNKLSAVCQKYLYVYY